jgi:hypothetical protein
MSESFEPTGQNCGDCGKPITFRVESVLAYHGQAPDRRYGPACWTPNCPGQRTREQQQQ